MLSPALSHMAALLRGFDRGDDPQQLAFMENVVQRGELRPGDLQYHAVLLIRATRFEEARRALERAIERGEGTSDTHYLLGLLLLRDGDHDGALREMERALSLTATPSSPRPLVDRDHALHGRALVKLATDDVAGARADLELAAASASPPILVDLARVLARAGETEPAMTRLRHVLRNEPWNAAAQLLLLELPGGAELATELFGDYPSPEVLDAIRTRPELASLRASPAFAPLLETPAPPDHGWLDALPPWFQALRADARLMDAGVEWLDAAARDARTDALRAGLASSGYPMGMLWNDALLAETREAVAHATVVGIGPKLVDRSGLDQSVRLVLDARRPDQLFAILAPTGPSALWIPCGASADSLAAVIGELWPVRHDTRVTFPRTVRFFGGDLQSTMVPSPYSGALEPAGPHELARHWAMSPWMWPDSWGSSQLDDPWPQRIPPQPALQLKVTGFQRQVQLQEDGGVASFSRRTAFSRSYVTFELHRRELYVIEVRYRPSACSAGVIGALNRRFNLAFPTDLPIDVVGALLGFEHRPVEILREGLVTAEHRAPYLVVMAALLCHDLVALRALLRAHLRSPDPAVVGTCANLAITYNLEFLLDDLMLAGVDDELAAKLRHVLEVGIGPEEFDDQGEPLGLYGNDDGYGDGYGDDAEGGR